MARKVIIAGNWKMNKTASEAKALVEELKAKVKDITSVEIVVCPPFTSIAAAVEAAAGSNVKVGAQNIHWAENGAFTGEISAQMLKECGVEYVIIGHSERRQYFGETDETVNKRLKAALSTDSNRWFALANCLKTAKAEILKKCCSPSLKAAWPESARNRWKRSLSHTNRYGRSAPARPRLRKWRMQPIAISGSSLAICSDRMLPQRPGFNTAAA